jgi:hypothetical protein
MAITYTWLDPDYETLKYVDDSTTPYTQFYIPADTDNPSYVEYVAWAAGGGVTGAYVYPGYADLASAKTSRLALAAESLTNFVKGGTYAFNFFRALADDTYTLPAGTKTKFSDAYSLYSTFETAINSETDIEKIRLSAIDFEADTYNIPS